MDALLIGQPFAPYGVSHWAVLVILVLGAAWLVTWGRRHCGGDSTARFCRWFALLILAIQAPLQFFSMLPPHWDLGQSLPLQLCDLAWMVTAYALWTHRPWAYSLTYYWSLSLTSQALVTPALQFDFPHLSFVMFWAGHGLAVLAAIFLTWGLGLRPDWRGYRFTVAATLSWMFVTLMFNFAAGTNYGFLNAKPPVRSILDLLGQWPWYLASEIALCAVVWALMTWPWTRAKTGTGRMD